MATAGVATAGVATAAAVAGEAAAVAWRRGVARMDARTALSMAHHWRQLCAEARAASRAADARPRRPSHDVEAAAGGEAAVEGGVLPPLSILIVFSGPERPFDGLATFLRAEGFTVIEVDTKVGGADHNVLRPRVAAEIEQRISNGEFAATFWAVPCESWSVAHRPQVRSRRQSGGLLAQLAVGGPLAHWAAYVAKHNRLADWTARCVRLAHAVGTLFLIENPADYGDDSSLAWWARFRDHAPLWAYPPMAAVRRELGAMLVTFAQCAFGAPVRKWTSLMGSAALQPEFAELAARVCTHASSDPSRRRAHETVAWGRNAHGVGRAAAAAAYPRDMNRFIARGLAAAIRRLAAGGAVLSTPRDSLVGGRVADGAELTASVAAYVEQARDGRRRFASTRNLLDESRAALAAEPMPGDLGNLIDPTRPNKAKAGKGRPLPAEPPRTAAATNADSSVRPSGKIRIEMLFDEGLYVSEVREGFMVDALAAVRDRLAGRTPRAVRTRVLSQSRMPQWARGRVWDCRDPTDCVEVIRSTRDTVFPGKQLDRAATRRIAAELGWPDTDLLSQAGEGGIETRSEASLDTVLSFHHNDLWSEWEKADELVRGDWEREWVSRPVADLPMVPSRVLPRNMVFAERSRVDDDGLLVRFMKPRVSQDSSDGHDASVNAGVPAHERFIRLPAAQSHARGAAIASTACDDGPPGVAVEGFAIDAMAAFRYCVLQLADLWTQVFVWWEWRNGQLWVGFCIDLRLAFGGAYSPNRFQRVTCLVMAHVQRLHLAYDDTRPRPAAAQRWEASRRQLQAEGRLPLGAAHLRAAGAQNYIDDLSGWGLNDVVYVCRQAVCVCGGACHVVIDDAAMLATGGRAAPFASRIHGYARLTIVGLRDFGLDEAAEKTMVGDPLISLGLRVDVGGWRLDCPASKAESMLADVRDQLEAGVERLRVDQRLARTLVGRLCNLTQVHPEMQPFMHGGYSVSEASWPRARPNATLQLRRGSRAFNGWTALLEVAEAMLHANEGVSLAPALRFPSRWSQGAVTVVTDASGVDGVGGYLFAADHPGHVWLLAERWPANIQTALDTAALPRSERAALPEGTWMLSMPAAELFGIVAMVAYGGGLDGPPPSPSSTTAVGDCEPAAAALNAATSPVPQMRRLVAGARRLSRQWLGVAVPREANLDADRLSHPVNQLAVAAEAAAAGLRVHEARVSSWLLLEQAAADGLSEAARPRRR